jgi:serine protease Do
MKLAYSYSRVVLGSILVSLLAVLVPVAIAAEPREGDKQPAKVYKEVVHATAMVLAQKGQGTGWLISRERKQMVTCLHVVGDSQEVEVLFPIYREGRVVTKQSEYQSAERVAAKVIHTDPRRDLALIEIAELPTGATELHLAAEAPQPGDIVHAVGCPGEVGALWVYSHGTVRAIAEDGPSGTTFVESQVPLNHGDSGGALVNDDGEVVGVNDAILPSKQLVSFSVEVSEIKKFLEEGLAQRIEERSPLMRSRKTLVHD